MDGDVSRTERDEDIEVSTGLPSLEQSQPHQQLTPEELMAKAIAPVKREFLRPLSARPSSTNPSNDAVSTENDKSAEPSSTTLVKEKKSKRQLKRERLQVLSHFLRYFFCSDSTHLDFYI